MAAMCDKTKSKVEIVKEIAAEFSEVLLVSCQLYGNGYTNVKIKYIFDIIFPKCNIKLNIPVRERIENYPWRK